MATFIADTAKCNFVNIEKVDAVCIRKSQNEENITFYNVYAVFAFNIYEEYPQRGLCLGKYESYDAALQKVSEITLLKRKKNNMI